MTKYLLTADHQAPGEMPDAEPVVVRTSAQAVELELHDGTLLTLPREQLEEALRRAERKAA